MSASMTSMDRVVTTLGHREPDRVPVFLLLTMHGAKELDLPLQAYFSQPDRMVEGQLRMRRRFGHDCLYGITYAAAEHQAFGGEVIFSDEGPPNAGARTSSRWSRRTWRAFRSCAGASSSSGASPRRRMARCPSSAARSDRPRCP